MKGIVISFVLLNCFLYINAFPLPHFPFDDDDFLDMKFPEFDIAKDCTKLGCESSATACSKKISTSEDKKTLNEEIKCFGSNGDQLSSKSNSKPNPLPGSIQNGYEYFGSSSSGSQTINVNGNQYHNTNLDNVETLSK